MTERERLDAAMAGAVVQCVHLQKLASAVGDEAWAWSLGQLRRDLFTAWQRALAVVEEQARAAEVAGK